MKSHWRFLRLRKCQYLHGFSAAGTNTPESPPLSHVQRSVHVFPVEHYGLKHALVTWNRNGQLLPIGQSTQKDSQWHSHCEERTTEICLRMLEAQMTPWSLWHQGRRSRTPAIPPTSLVQGPPQMMLLWVLLSPDRCIHRESTSTAPGWAGHIEQCGLEVDDIIRALPTLLFNFLLSSHHILITAHKMLQMLKKKMSHYHKTCIPPLWGSCHLLSISAQRWGTLKEYNCLAVFFFPILTCRCRWYRNIQPLKGS